jgi:hypothetical protein
MRNKLLVFICLAIIVGLCAWSPWLTEATASKLAENQFNHAWEGVMDGCGTASADLGAEGFRKVPFGAYVTLAYQCGLVMPDEPPLHHEIYISLVGIAFGYPKP